MILSNNLNILQAFCFEVSIKVRRSNFVEDATDLRQTAVGYGSSDVGVPQPAQV